MAYEKKTLTTIGSLWKNANESRDRMPLKGNLGGRNSQIKVMIFKNDRKESEKHPDYRIVIESDGQEDLLALLGVESRPAPKPADDDEAPF